MKRSSWLVGGLSLLALSAVEAGSEQAAQAYKFYMTKDGVSPLRWWQRDSLSFHLSTVAPEEIAWDGVQGLVESAFDAWIGTSCGRVPETTFAGTNDATHATTPVSLRAEPDNTMVFIRTSAEWAQLGNSSTWIAITKIAHDPETGEIVDADIEINDGGYRFSYDDSPGANEVDFLSMLTHELGHFYGLDHSADMDATMFATYATSAEHAMDARTLSQDDIDGICTLYTNVPVHKVPTPSDDCAAGGATGMSGGLLALASLARALRRRDVARGEA